MGTQKNRLNDLEHSTVSGLFLTIDMGVSALIMALMLIKAFVFTMSASCLTDK